MEKKQLIFIGEEDLRSSFHPTVVFQLNTCILNRALEACSKKLRDSLMPKLSMLAYYLQGMRRAMIEPFSNNQNGAFVPFYSAFHELLHAVGYLMFWAEASIVRHSHPGRSMKKSRKKNFKFLKKSDQKCAPLLAFRIDGFQRLIRHQDRGSMDTASDDDNFTRRFQPLLPMKQRSFVDEYIKLSDRKEILAC